MSEAISLTFPDGSVRSYPAGTTGREVAESISKSLAKKAVAIALDGTVRDLSETITDGKIEIVTREDGRALELIRHDAAHVMAEAVQELWPGTQVTIGPVIENGFYYDFAKNEPFTPEDLPKIEKRMKEIILRNKPFTREIWSREKAKEVFAAKGENYKVELVDAIPEGQDLKIYYQGDWFDLCRGPHMASTGQIGTAFKLMKVVAPIGAAIATMRCCRASMAPPGRRRKSWTIICTCWPKPKSATTAALAAKWTCSISRKKVRALCSGTARAGACSRR